MMANCPVPTRILTHIHGLGPDNYHGDQAGGGDPLTVYPPVKATAVEFQSVSQNLFDKPVPGFRPSGMLTYFKPVPTDGGKPTRLLCTQNQYSQARGRGHTIYGTNDRYLFYDTRRFPWCLVGRFRVPGKIGSGCLVGPRHVLTASHLIDWTPDSDGNIAWASFTPGYYDGRGPWGELAVEEIFYWKQINDPTSSADTAFNYVVCVLHDRTIGARLGYAGADHVYNPAWNRCAYWQTLGYPADLTGGAERPAFHHNCVIDSVGAWNLGGHMGFVLNHYNDIFAGQIGGPVWGYWGGQAVPSVVGVVSREPFILETGCNEYAGGPALKELIDWVRRERP